MRRPKDAVREYIGERRASSFELQHLLYGFAYWLEGQDREGMACRYHIVPAVESDCPFDPPEEIDA